MLRIFFFWKGFTINGRSHDLHTENPHYNCWHLRFLMIGYGKDPVSTLGPESNFGSCKDPFFRMNKVKMDASCVMIATMFFS